MIEVYKKKYQTCLELIEELRLNRPELQNEVLSYNGILDPMAEGIVPILVGEENKRRNDFTGSEKVYQVDVLVGVVTDSGDLLGIVTNSSSTKYIDEDLIAAFLDSPRKFNQTVPMHSNRKVHGKRLWWWALRGIVIPKEKRPVNSVELKKITFLDKRAVTKDELKDSILQMKQNIGERFRLQKVAASWEDLFNQSTQDVFTVITFEVHVTSGFYVRTFVEEIGDTLGIPLLVSALKRTRIIYSSGN